MAFRISPAVSRFLLTMAIGAIVGVMISEVSFRLTKSAGRETPQRIELVIPAGTAQRVSAGQQVPSIPAKMEFIQGDVRDMAVLRRALDGVEVVFHEAAEVGVGQSMYEVTRYVGGNTYATAVLLEVLANEKHTVNRLIVASSMWRRSSSALARILSASPRRMGNGRSGSA